jgi:serine/threonine protein kinase
VIHRDLKPGNVLISAENHVKLGDFGLGKTFNRNQVLTGHWKMTGNTGTIRYMAPEVKRFLPYDERVDIYSFGLLTWYMATAKLPFGDIKTRWLWKDLDGVEYESYWAKYSADELSPEHHCVEGGPWRGRTSGLVQGGEGLTEPLSFLKSSFSRMSSDSKHTEASSIWASPSKGVPMDSTSPKQKAITKVINSRPWNLDLDP